MFAVESEPHSESVTTLEMLAFPLERTRMRTASVMVEIV